MEGYESQDGRVLEQNSFRFGDYDISYALCSYGDVIKNFYDSGKLGMLIADTMGHDAETGKDFADYIDENIRPEGWGTGPDAEKELSALSERFPRDDSEYLPSSPWKPVGAFLRLDKDSGLEQIAFGGIEKPIYVHSDGKTETLDLRGYLDLYDTAEHSPCHKIDMKSGDMLLLSSDGMKDNMEAHGYKDPQADIGTLLEYNRQNGAEDIVSTITDSRGFGSRWLPQDEKDDDISLILVKKL
ncbi:MAG: SpoIIE family protein phosphatase [Candidatus Woesearchaeota archaeon]